MKSIRSVFPLFMTAALLVTPVQLSLAQSTSDPDMVIRANTFVEIAEKSLPAVISINVRVLPSQEFMDKHGATSLDELRDQIFGDPGAARDMWRNFNPDMFGSLGSGSGVIIRVEGDEAYAITNRHVLDSSQRVEYTVVLDNSLSEIPSEVKSPDVSVVGTDELTDIAVIKFKIPEGVKLHTLDFANSDEAMIGEFVLALGNPLDLNNSVSHGIISAKNRNISQDTRIENLLQTTAVINPGNSGGPLVNLDGNIIGINNAIATTTGRWAGVGFAIPSNQARRIGDMLIDTGEVSRGYLGIRMQTEKDVKGVEIMAVNDDTPAKSAGLERGDIVMRVDGVRVADTRNLLAEIGNRMAGETVKVDVLRGDIGNREEMTFEIALAQRPDETELDTRPSFRNFGFNSDGSDDFQKPAEMPYIQKLNVELEEKTIDGVEGLFIKSLNRNGKAFEAGLRKDDLIVQVNGIIVKNLDELEEGFENTASSDNHTVLFYRDGESRFINLSLD